LYINTQMNYARGNLILHGGFFLSNSLVNISLYRSNLWTKGTLIIDKKPFYRLYPIKDNYIEIQNVNNHYLLLVNKMIIYKNTYAFGYTIDIKTSDKTATDFYKYHPIPF
jgi:hypothetical protein